MPREKRMMTGRAAADGTSGAQIDPTPEGIAPLAGSDSGHARYGLAATRRSFPAVDEAVYLSVCDRAILPNESRLAIERYLAAMGGALATKLDHEPVVAAARRRFAELIGAAATEVAFVRNVSDGVNSIAWAMPWRPGDNLVICLELEHPNNVYPWLRLQKFGVELRNVPARAGRLDVPAMLAAIDDRTRLLTCASVTFSPGLRTDLGQLGRGCRSRDVFFLVDAVQSAGILEHDVETLAIDGLTTSTSKGLLGIYGSGFLYCRSAWIDRLEPAYLSRTGVDVAPDKLSEMGSLDYALQPDARRFEVGSHAFAGAYGVEASLALIQKLGQPTIEAHVLELARQLADGMATLGLDVFGRNATPAEGSHIVTVGQLGAGGHAVTTDALLMDLHRTLMADKIIHTVRRGQLRFAFHLYNTGEEVAEVLDITRRFLRRRD